MIRAADAIARTRRDLTVGTVIRYALVIGAGAAVLVGGLKLEPVIVGLLAVWTFLAFRTAQGARMAAESPALIAAGRYDEAERRIERAVRAFIPSRAAKLTNLYNLASLRHAQHRWTESAELARVVLRYRSPGLTGVRRSTRIMLAEALLESGDLPGTYLALAPLYDDRLALPEAMNLLAVQLDYESRVGLWEHMIDSIPTKVQLAELLPPDRSARTQALLALAARHTGRTDWAQFLRRRVELLADPTELTARRPALSDLWNPDPKEVGHAPSLDTTINPDGPGL